MEAPEIHNIGLCLSGGGLRATFFHLGLLRFLYEANLLSRVRRICSVSAGSIIAAHLVTYWGEYNGSPEQFDRAASELLSFGRLDLRGRVLRRWSLSFVFPLIRLMPRRFWDRTALLQRYYSAYLFKGRTLSSLEGASEAASAPELHILATSMTTGDLYSFTKDGLWAERGQGPQLIRSGLLPLGIAVAASSAFPPLFPPVQISQEMLDATDAEMPYGPELLTDGGIFDNLGVRHFYELNQRNDIGIELLIVSDAGAGFDWQVGRRFGSIIARTARTTDILMKRVGEFERNQAIAKHFLPKTLIAACAIDTIVSPSCDRSAITPDLQKKVRRIRTDLDRFSLDEINALIRHGHAVAKTTLKEMVGQAAAVETPPARSLLWKEMRREPSRRLSKRLESARHRSLGFWNPRDWTSWVLTGLVTISAALIVLSFYLSFLALSERSALKSADANVQIFYVTNRSHSSQNALSGYSDSSMGELEVGTGRVGVSNGHRMSNVETPGWLRFILDPSKDAVLSSIRAMDFESFLSRIDNLLHISKAKTVLILVPGVGVNFEGGVERLATLGYDLRTDAIKIGFSWPSGKFSDAEGYDASRRNADLSVPVLARLVTALSTGANRARLVVIAEGLGAEITLNAALQFRSAQRSTGPLFDQVIFVNPDIAVSRFREAQERNVPLGKYAATVYRATTFDMAFVRSMLPSARLGDIYTQVREMPGVNLIDVSTKVASWTAFDDGAIVSDIFLVLHGLPPEERLGMRRTYPGEFALSR
jgi:esterase/lipase superfamily enzyme/predicted acylesterase/phospholipase RssA